MTLVDVDTDHSTRSAATGWCCVTPTAASDRVDGRDDVDPASELDPVDAVIVLCKGWANRDVAESIAGAVGRSTWVATIQNGLGNDVALAAVLGPERVLPGTTTAGAHEVGAGRRRGVADHLERALDHPARSAAHRPRDPDGVDAFTSALTTAGLPCEMLADADRRDLDEAGDGRDGRTAHGRPRHHGAGDDREPDGDAPCCAGCSTRSSPSPRRRGSTLDRDGGVGPRHDHLRRRRPAHHLDGRRRAQRSTQRDRLVLRRAVAARRRARRARRPPTT